MIKKRVDIFCKCGTWLHCGINISATQARRIARDAGWHTSTVRGDVCPGCRKQ